MRSHKLILDRYSLRARRRGVIVIGRAGDGTQDHGPELDMSDQHLLNCIAAGDQAAFAEFYDRHAPRVLSLLRKWLNPCGDAEDVLQEVFWQVWRRASQYDPGRAPPEVWLVLIARSRALDHLRQYRTEAPSTMRSEPSILNDPGGAVERREAAQQVRAALAELPEEQRTAITLAFFAGLTYEQVAQRLTIPLGTAKTRIRLGMRRLRDLLRS